MVITRMMADRGQPSQSPTPTENIFDYLPRTQNGINSSGNVGGIEVGQAGPFITPLSTGKNILNVLTTKHT